METNKPEMHEMNESQAEITSLGTLKDLLPDVEFKGSISLKERLDSNETTTAELEQFEKLVSESYVSVSRGAHLRCVDGRGEVGYETADNDSSQLGPQIQGGTVDIAASRRLRKGVEAGVTLVSDVEDVVATTNPNVAPGGHTDDHAKDDEFGCGAVKTQEAKLGHYLNEKTLSNITGVVDAIYSAAGIELSPDTFSNLAENATELKEMAEQYYAVKPKIVDYLTKFGEKAKQIVTGKHAELEVWLNFVEDTTLNTGKLNAVTGGAKQVFGLDVWYILKEYPEDAPFILADALATLMEITDGTLEVKARTSVALAA